MDYIPVSMRLLSCASKHLKSLPSNQKRLEDRELLPIHNEPFEVRPDMVADAIMAADAMGRTWKKDHSPS